MLVHRFAHGNTPAQSDCSALVEEVHPLPGQDALVRFTDATTRNDASRMTPGHEHNYY